MAIWRDTVVFTIFSIILIQISCISTENPRQLDTISSSNSADFDINTLDVTLQKEEDGTHFGLNATSASTDQTHLDVKNTISNSEGVNGKEKTNLKQLLTGTSNTEITTEIRTMPDTGGYEMPQKWKGFCGIDNTNYIESKFTPKTRLTTITCNITDEFSGVWNMSDLRDSLRSFANSNLAFSVDIQCENMSIISLSNPMQIYSLYKLSVKGCTVMDYLAENSNESLDTIPDSLREVELRDNTVLIGLRTFLSMMKNVKNISKEFDCIHEDTIESIVNRNIHYDFMLDIDPTQVNFTELGEVFIHDAKRVDHKCNYVHLMKLDQGHMDSRSVYHMDLMTENSFYDELLVFNYSYNRIKQLDDQQLKWSSQFPKLEMFDLSHNEISKIYRFLVPLHTSNRVTTINLQHNNISTITVKDLNSFKDIPTMFIDLKNNPIDCNCSEELKELLGYITEGKHLRISHLSSYEYIGQLQCASPDRLVGRTLASLNEDTVCEPEVEYYLVPLVCMSVAVFVLCICLFITLRYRQEITIILFTRFNIIVPCYSRETFDSNKKFDAFISYSSNEEEHIEKLFEDLEKPSDSRAHFKFCLHHRDFVPGKTIFDNVVTSIEASRHTIIILSKHFLNSQYCVHEFQEAFRQSIMEQKRHLVIVMMEDISEDKLPRDIKRCIKTFTYIRRDDYLFQERLIYALSVKQKSKTVKQTPKNKSKSDSTSTAGTSISKSTNGPLNKSTSGNMSKTSNLHQDLSESNDSVFYTSQKSLTNENELNKVSVTNNNENVIPVNSKIHKCSSHKLEVNIKPTVEKIPCLVERKISNDYYDRSMSTDTGYGSERGSYCEKLSPEVSLEIGEFPKQLEVTC